MDDRYDQDGPGLLDAMGTDVPAATDADTKDGAITSAKPVRKTPAKAAAAKPASTSTRSRRKPADTTASSPGTDRDAPPPLALYRRYRPDTFADVIGQEHVTEPLMRALTNNKVNHAYLFSGPRGCGKTSSARILARCLNCEKGPTATPCGECQSCRDLATGGPGSIDVIEMDAASHGLVDDARDLRERAFFVPVQSRYKVYIIDEAHMVTTQGFNALLKLVEEPPPHVKFIFATTEPDKVIGTIRSRTHYYPFRLVPPKTMQAYLQKICDEEGVFVEPGVLPMVVRAGAGSVRDALSVLDQLLGSAGPQGVTYDNATALLGYTPDALLDQTMDALAAKDGAGVYSAIDMVIEAGQDPRHFAADLLQRLRDVMVVASVPDALSSGLIDVAADQGERLKAQATAMGQDRLIHAADVISQGLTGMRGTTAPRLHLELMCARAILPAEDFAALSTRLDSIERRLVAGVPTQQPANTPARTYAPPERRRIAQPEAPSGPPRQQRPPSPVATSMPAASPTMPARTAPPSTTSYQLTDLQRAWSDVLDRVKQTKRYTWVLLDQHGRLVDLQNDNIIIEFTSAGARDNYLTGANSQILGDALAAVTGSRWRVTAVITGENSRTPTQRPANPPDPGTTPVAHSAAPATSSATPATPRTPSLSTVYDEDDSTDNSGASIDDDDVDDSTDAASLLSAALGAQLIAEEDDDDV